VEALLYDENVHKIDCQWFKKIDTPDSATFCNKLQHFSTNGTKFYLGIMLRPDKQPFEPALRLTANFITFTRQITDKWQTRY
jgi:hypothetical protein